MNFNWYLIYVNCWKIKSKSLCVFRNLHQASWFNHMSQESFKIKKCTEFSD